MNRRGYYFDFQLAGDFSEQFAVVDFTLEEALNSLYTLQLNLVSRHPAIDLQDLILRKATFSAYNHGQLQRKTVGVIASAAKGKTGFHRTYYQITLRPTLWLLTQRHLSRLYHHKNIPQILEQLLKAHEVPYELRLYDDHEPRPMTIQRREYEYDFFNRLAAQAGLVYWVETNDDSQQDTCVITDNYLGYKRSKNLWLTYNENPAVGTQDKLIHKIEYRINMTPQQYRGQDWKPNRPRTYHQHTTTALTVPRSLDFYQFYDGNPRLPNPAVSDQIAEYRLEALQATSKIGRAESNYIRLQPGKGFRLLAHPDDTLNQRWQPIRIYHQGSLPQSLEEDGQQSGGAFFSNQIEFIPDDVTWRPTAKPAPTAEGPETAIVIGPEGEEIYTNDNGEVSVRFHWDLDGSATCWVRVAQEWSGNHYGFYAIPRIGQEVIIDYLEGDLDRPIITGSVYNYADRHPLNLPEEKTHTIIKTKTHKGTGYNELRFDDSTDNERIYLHAQKNLELQVLNSHQTRIEYDSQTSIGHDETHSVANDRIVTIEGKAHYRTGSDHLSEIGGDHHHRVKGDLAQQISGMVSMDAQGALVLQSHDKITLRVGNHFIAIHEGGININGSQVTAGPAFSIQGAGSAGEVVLPTSPAIVDIAAAEGVPFMAHCPEKSAVNQAMLDCFDAPSVKADIDDLSALLIDHHHTNQ